MTTLEIETYANEEDLSTGSNDVNLAVRLRRKVMPKFEADVGHASWRRKTATIAIVQGTREYTLPTDFSDMLDWPVYEITAGVIQSMLFYIGENAPLMAVSEGNTTQGTPTGYWIKRLASGTAYQRSLTLSHIPSAAGTLRYGYLSSVQFADFTTSVELDNYIPLHLQWGLVEALKAELYLVRFGIEDPRFQAARKAYDEYVLNGQEYAEQGRRNVLKKIRVGPS